MARGLVFNQQQSADAFFSQHGIGGGYLYNQPAVTQQAVAPQQVIAPSMAAASGYFPSNVGRGMRPVNQSASMGMVDSLMAAKTGLDIARLSGTTTLSSGINSAAAYVAPGVFGQGAPVAGGVGPSAPGVATQAGYSASGILGGAGIGYTVGTFNPLAKKQAGSQVGGAIGGAALSAFGPVGIALGSFIGSTIGGFFGKGKPRPASTSGINYDEQGNYVNEGVQTNKMGTEVGQAFLDEHKTLLAGVTQAGGVVKANAKFVGGYLGGTGFVSDSHDAANSAGYRTFDINDSNAASNAVVRNVFAQIDYSKIADKGVAKALQEIDLNGKDVRAVLAEISSLGAKAKTGVVAASPAYAPSATVKLQQKVEAAKAQMEQFMSKVKKGKTSIASTILTGPRGVSDDMLNLGALRLGSA